ncbi:MAG TPA: DUF5710 domain-containing protein [Polyangiales bacterium]
MDEKIWLHVQRAEADDAKSLGARWDADAQRWWITPALIAQVREDCPGWLAPLDHSLLVEGTLRAVSSQQRCPKCDSEATVIALLASGTRMATPSPPDQPWGPSEPSAMFLRELKAIEDPELRMLLSKRWPGYRVHRSGPYANRCRLCNYEFAEAALHAPGGPFHRLEKTDDGTLQIHAVEVCLPTFFSAERALPAQEPSAGLHARSAA